MTMKKILLSILLFGAFALQRISAQQTTVSGKVISATDRSAIAGATILVKGATTGVPSAADGSFRISVSGSNAVLLVSHIGYETAGIPLHGQTSVEITLTATNNQLGDVVVIGYGTVKKKDLTGSVAQVTSKDLDAFATGNVLQSLNGRASGVRVIQNDGTPGAPPSIRIRGTNSILGSNEPLYVIDGFPGTPNSLQSTDIESMEILKDASATAIYGSRGANGVVIITTKRGKPGKTRVDYETSYGIQSASKILKLMNNTQWTQFYNLQAANDGLTPYFTSSQVDSIAKSPSTDWQRKVLRDAPVTLQSLTVSGGDQKTQFSVSGNAFLQDGIITNSGYDRYTLRANLNHNISKFFTINYNTLLSREVTHTKPTGVGSNRGSGLVNAMLTASPAIGPFNADGTLKRINTVYPWLSNVLINPLTVIREQSNRTIANRELGNVAFNIKPLDGLIIKIAGGIQNEDDRNDAFVQIDPIINSTGSASVGTTQITSLLSENTVSYNKTFGNHSLSAVGGFTYQDYITTTLGASGTGFLSNTEQSYDLAGAATQGISTSSYSKWILFSWLGRLNYAYKGKYLATVSFRRDGSSKFSALDKWADFPSAALAWRISDEPFLKPVSWLSNLKLRTTYGAAGNNALNPYQTLNALGASSVVFNDGLYTAYGPGTTKPGQLKWETTYSTDAGLDIGLFENRLGLSVDYYYKKTKNLLNTVQLPASTGYVSTLQNVGIIQNKGWEFNADIHVIDAAVKWNINANISLNRNRVDKLYGGQDLYGSTIYTGSINDFVNLLRVGKPLGIFYGYVENGYTATGNIQYKDLNKDGLINSLDKTYIGDPNPKFIYGFNSDLSWKGFDLSFFIEGTQGNDIFNVNATQTIDLGFALNEPADEFTNHWTSTNTKAKYPKITKSITGNISNRYVENGSYLRFRNIQLGWTLPGKLLPWTRNIQVYVSGQNLITVTKYSWYDPEINSLGSGNSINQGIDYYGYPTAKTITFGLRCGF